MCLIIAIKSGVEKYSDFLMNAVKTASFSNTDGIGFTFKRKSTGKIFITKGYQSFKDFKKAYTNKNLSDKDEVLIHLRIGNRGAKNTSMNHPFVVSNKPDEILLNNCYINKPTLVHNGTFIDYSLTGSSFSDTYFFVKDFMSIKELQDLLIRDEELFKTLFKDTIKTNKLGFLFPGSKELVTIGSFIEDKGYLFSNISYKEEKYKNVGGFESYVDSYVEETNHRKSNNFLKNLTKSKDPVLKYSTVSAFQNKIMHKGIHIDKTVENLFLHNFCDSIYVPVNNYEDKGGQYVLSKFLIKRWNYNHFFFVSYVNDSSLGLVKGKTYMINKFDETGRSHEVVQMLGSTKLHISYMSTDDIYENMTVDVDRQNYCDYRDVYRIFTTCNIMSKNQLKKLDNLLDKMYNSKKDTITYQGLKDISLKTLQILYNYTVDFIEGEDSWKAQSTITDFSSFEQYQIPNLKLLN